jgi:putative addiction module killer protein
LNHEEQGFGKENLRDGEPENERLKFVLLWPISLIVTYVLLFIFMVEIVEYVTESGKNTFAVWFEKLSAPAAAKVTVGLRRIETGNFSNVKGVEGGVFEYRIDFGPGYRVYFGKDGDRLVILLAGGTKKKQQQDIETAQQLWREYKNAK